MCSVHRSVAPFRAECLDTNQFQSLPETKHVIEGWRQDTMKAVLTVLSLNRTPAEFASQVVACREVTETKTGRSLTL